MSDVITTKSNYQELESVSDPPTAVPSVRVPAAEDYETWSDEELMQHGVARISQADKHHQRCITLGRQTIEERMDAASVLCIVRQRHQADGKWCEIQDRYGLPRTTVWEVIQVYERSAAMGHTKEEVVRNYETWTEVLVAYGVAKKRERRPMVPAENHDDMKQEGDKSYQTEPLVPAAGNGEQRPPRATPARPVEKAKDEDQSVAPAGNGPTQPEQTAEANSAKVAPPPKKAEKKEQPDLSPCEIDAATIFVKAVGGWARAVRVLELVKAVLEEAMR